MGPQGPRGFDGEPGPQGPRGFTGFVRPDWAAMSVAAGAIRYTPDPISMGVALGRAERANAVAVGIRVDHGKARIHGSLMRSLDGESGAAFGISIGLPSW